MTEPLSRRHALGAAAAAGVGAFFAGAAAGTAKAASQGGARATGPAPRSRRAPVPPGVYAISKPNDQLLTLDSPEGPVFVLSPLGQPTVQEWQVGALPNGNVVLRNLRQGTFAGYAGEPQPNKFVVGRPDPVEWVLRRSSEPYAFFIVVPGGPVNGVELVLDLSLLRIYPPRAALRPWYPYDQDQAWTFTFHE